MYSAAGLGLAEYNHQAETSNIETNGNHVGRDRDIHASLSLKGRDSVAFGFRYLRSADAAGQFDRFVVDLAIRRRALRFHQLRFRSL